MSTDGRGDHFVNYGVKSPAFIQFSKLAEASALFSGSQLVTVPSRHIFAPALHWFSTTGSATDVSYASAIDKLVEATDEPGLVVMETAGLLVTCILGSGQVRSILERVSRFESEWDSVALGEVKGVRPSLLIQLLNWCEAISTNPDHQGDRAWFCSKSDEKLDRFALNLVLPKCHWPVTETSQLSTSRFLVVRTVGTVVVYERGGLGEPRQTGSVSWDQASNRFMCKTVAKLTDHSVLSFGETEEGAIGMNLLASHRQRTAQTGSETMVTSGLAGQSLVLDPGVSTIVCGTSRRSCERSIQAHEFASSLMQLGSAQAVPVESLSLDSASFRSAAILRSRGLPLIGIERFDDSTGLTFIVLLSMDGVVVAIGWGSDMTAAAASALQILLSGRLDVGLNAVAVSDRAQRTDVSGHSSYLEWAECHWLLHEGDSPNFAGRTWTMQRHVSAVVRYRRSPGGVG